MSRTHRTLAALAVSALMRNAAALALPALTAAAIAEILRHGRADAGTVVLLATCVLALAAGDAGTSLSTSSAVAHGTAERRLRVMRHLFVVRRTPEPGDATTRVVHAAADAARAPVAILTTTIALIAAVVAAGLIWWTDWATGLALTLTVPTIWLVSRRSVGLLRTTQSDYLTAQTALSERLLSVVANARTVRASNTTETEIERTLAALPALSRAGRRNWGGQRTMVLRIRLVVAAVELVTLSVAGLSVAAGRLAPADLVAIAGFTALALGGVDQIDAVSELVLAGASRRRVRELLDRPTHPAGQQTATALGPPAVRWSGAAVTDAVTGIELDLPAGSSTAVVGRSGAGKSVLAGTVSGLVALDAGTVTIGGLDVTRLETDAVAAVVAHAFDDPALLGDTVADVVAYPDDPAELDVRAAAIRACADTFISRLPDGYATRLTDCPLSGGERQRLGLARAFAHPAAVLVLDDAASGLDAVTAAEIRRAVLSGRGTRLIVATHADTAAACDRVVWLEDGRVRALGTHRDLSADPDYRALFGPPAQKESPDAASMTGAAA